MRALIVCIGLVVGGCVDRATTEAGDAASTGGDPGATTDATSSGPPLQTTTTSPGTGETTANPVTTESSSSSGHGTDATTGFVSHCEVPPDVLPICWDVICEQFACGYASSLYDLDGCPRTRCDGAADCPAPTFCNATILSSACAGGQAGGWDCFESEGQCVCGGSLGCGYPSDGYCLDPSEFSQSDLCVAAERSCDDLPSLIVEIQYGLGELGADMSPELLAQARECQWARLQRLFSECGGSPCEFLCDDLPEAGCPTADCSTCVDDDPEVLELLQAVAELTICADCRLCAELDNELCAAVYGC